MRNLCCSKNADQDKIRSSSIRKYHAVHSFFSKSWNIFFHRALLNSLPSFRKRDEPIPDPIKLLRRLAALESSMEKLKVECADFVEQRTELVLSVTSLQIENVSRLQQVRRLFDFFFVGGIFLNLPNYQRDSFPSCWEGALRQTIDSGNRWGRP